MTTINRLTAAAGFDWYRQGWKLFARKPGMLVLLGLALAVIYLLLNLVPLGGLLLAFIAPSLNGGYYLAIRRTEAGEEPGFADLFAAFNEPQRRNPMLMLGLVSLGAQIAITLTMIGAFGGTFAALAGFSGMLTGLPIIGGGLGFSLFAILSGLVIAVLLWLALFFAIPLVMLDGVAPSEALKISLRANLSNVAAWLIFSVLLVPLTVLALIPFGLGLLILYPLMTAAMYIAYRQTFTHDEELPQLR
ncbi:BPSS1780 family membrane protein [Acidihalobacter ferrooxydans]|uniref:DUF2189 domain-containing protein n=1 Tax=Acidihalobacter ferrooxydans TaxID=1765967 RepID=A0A1P8UHT0_9GAMM|nr:BPSS1780 family membrane protein [Acidihalobacter ferrooxydans]APZ43405.1 hypothetical protein BW247_10130 [Acidihalobacter ferrooxydans]